MTVSWFFRSVLCLDDHESEAMELAGLVSPTVARRLAATLPCGTDDATGLPVGDPPADEPPPTRESPPAGDGPS